MPLSKYHDKYSQLSDAEIRKRVREKDLELSDIFKFCSLKTTDKTIKIAVLGCADKRYIKAHKKLFEKHTKKPVQVFTFDMSIDHLKNEAGVIKHDCTKPLPEEPFDIVYSHVLLRFIETDRQWNVLANSYKALKPGGFAIHILDHKDYQTKSRMLDNGLFSVPFEKLKTSLSSENITFKEIPIKYGIAIVLIK